jgi:hypothetical protein
MSSALWLRLLPWLGAYLVTALGCSFIGRWVVARVQGRPSSGWLWPTLGQGRGTALHLAALLAALAAGSAVPLGAPFEWGGRPYGWHVLGEVEGGMVIASSLTWVAAGLLIAHDRIGGAWSPPVREALGLVLVCGAVSLLAMPGLAMVASPLAERGGAGLGVANVIAAQERWHGLGWLGITQPLALLAWAACTLTVSPKGQGSSSLAWQFITLNWALLTAAAFLGGWQGPLATRFTLLPHLYIAAKAGVLVALRAWVGARLPIGHPLRQARTAWMVYLPAFVVNLLITAGLAVMR